MHYFEKTTWQQTISKTGFFVSLISYGIFFASDLLRPGFVARVFSVHLFLMSTVVFGVWWLIVLKKERDRIVGQYLLILLLGILTAMLTWKLGQGFAELRVLLTFLALFIPLIVLQIIRKSN